MKSDAHTTSWVIELLGVGRRAFVESYSNTAAAPRATFAIGQAKPFSSKHEAFDWADQYLRGFNYVIIRA